jgi:Domain of unknown function (DUF5668)
MNTVSKCKCTHHAVVPSLVVLIGLVVLLGNFGVLSAEIAGTIWPFALILIGFMKMCGKKCNCCCSCGCTGCQKDQSCKPSC